MASPTLLLSLSAQHSPVTLCTSLSFSTAQHQVSLLPRLLVPPPVLLSPSPASCSSGSVPTGLSPPPVFRLLSALCCLLCWSAVLPLLFVHDSALPPPLHVPSRGVPIRFPSHDMMCDVCVETAEPTEHSRAHTNYMPYLRQRGSQACSRLD